jgi:hypothetical protein
MKTLALLLALPATLLAVTPGLTIYNENFAVVRETIPLDLSAGINEIRFDGVTSLLEPDSVMLRDPSGKVDLQILEQNFRNDPVSLTLMLSRFEGREIDFLVREPEKPNRTVRGRVIRSGYLPPAVRQRGGYTASEPLIEVEGRLQFSLPGLPVFPALADDTLLKPELNWKLNASAAAQVAAELAYLTAGMSWAADYNLVGTEAGDTLDLTGWITMENQSGRSFENAAVKLMAGDVNKIQPLKTAEGRKLAFDLATTAARPPVSEKAFDEYHLYTLARPVTLRDQETKQVEFLQARGIVSERLYVYDGGAVNSPRWSGYDPVSRRQNPEYGTESNPKVWVMREFKNTRENQLGLPLPKGRMRFYQRDEDGRLEFVGENEIDHTPQGETIRVHVGNAFDIVGERKRTNFRVDTSNNWADESFAITLRNRKKEPVEVRMAETLYRWVNWEIREKSAPFTKIDSQKIEFRVSLKPDEEKTITYLVHYSW